MKFNLIILISFLFFGCIRQPNEPIDDQKSLKSNTIILCEGLWNNNNSSIDIIDTSYKSINNNVFFKSNNQQLGDLANDLVIKGDTIFVVLSTQNQVLLLNKTDFKLLKRIDLKGERLPRKCVIYKNYLLITDLLNNALLVLDYNSGLIIKEIPIGSAPEGIEIINSNAYIVNSGYGDYQKDHPKASTISIVDLTTLTERTFFKTGSNPIEIIKSEKRNSYFVCYRNLPSLKDTVGGIIEYDLSNKVKNQWICKSSSICLDYDQNKLFFISDYGISFINLEDNKFTNLILRTNKLENWYSLNINKSSDLFIGNAFNFQMEGEIMIYSGKNISEISKLKCGINPNKIVFY